MWADWSCMRLVAQQQPHLPPHLLPPRHLPLRAPHQQLPHPHMHRLRTVQQTCRLQRLLLSHMLVSSQQESLLHFDG